MILDEIVEYNQRELEKIKESFPLEELRKAFFEQPEPLDFAAVLQGDMPGHFNYHICPAQRGQGP